MLNFFKKKEGKNILPYIDDEGNMYDADDVTVYYEGTLISPEYAAETLIWQNNGKKLRDDFNTQPYPHHMLLPHGKGKMIYKDGDDILEQYEGEFQHGQYHGKGTLVDMHGEILEGVFKENKFIEDQ
tara:strand:- start:36 stop:416 length:381 start_codon:yes stop_codon:yes gene_type:complete